MTPPKDKRPPSRREATMLTETEQIKSFRQLINIKKASGASGEEEGYLLLRALTPEDKPRLLEFIATISEEDLRYFGHFANAAIIEEWCQDVNYQHALPLLAFNKERIVGSACLTFFAGPKRHIGQVHIILAKDYRRRGLGTKMLRALIELGRKRGLSLLIAEVIANMPKVIKAFEQLGFKPHCTLEDFYLLLDGETCDVILMTLSLQPKLDEF
jgi:RimJ/RimL family protein N-acetyltransferase